MFLQLLAPYFLFFLLPALFLFLKLRASSSNHNKKPLPSSTVTIPKSYPIIGSYLDIIANADRPIQWSSEILLISPSNTFTLHRLGGWRQVFTANPAVVQHILKTHFPIYRKGDTFHSPLNDLLGNGIFNADGQTWKFQRQVASHEFNTKSLRKFVEQVVDTEISDQLVPILGTAATENRVLDFQDILRRFAFDNICKIAFGYEPACLSPSLEQTKFAQAFEYATEISSKRLRRAAPIFWKIQKQFNTGSEKQLRAAISEVREFAKKIIREKKQELHEKASLDSVDMLSRFLSSGHSEEEFVADVVISIILAGKDTTSAALTWFFWLLSKNPEVEHEILKEITEKSEPSVYDEVTDMVYTHAALSESMRLYPPVPMDTKEAADDDILPDGTVVKRGMRVTYHVYAMGRLKELWGPDWAEFRPERWLKRVETPQSGTGKWKFVARDSFSYPVFQAGPRICLGKEMAFLQMKRVVAAILRRFRVVPAEAEGVEPEFIAFLTAKMKGGFPVRIEKRVENKLEIA